jgi:serine/threonine-protein kinase RsbW
MSERRFGRQLASLEALSRFAVEFFAAHGIPTAHLSEADLVIEELFTNCVKYHPESLEDIAVGLGWTPPVLTVVVRDFGVTNFDVTKVPPFDPDTPIEARRRGGLGLGLVRRLAEDMRYEHVDGTSTVTVTMRLAS